MIIKKRFIDLFDKKIDYAINHDQSEIIFDSIEKHISWSITITHFRILNVRDNGDIQHGDDSLIKIDFNVISFLPKNIKNIKSILQPVFSFSLGDKNKFYDTLYDEISYLMSFSFCACGSYKFNEYKYCIHCWLTIPYCTNECPVCYKSMLDHNKHTHTEQCCKTKVCIDCKKKFNKKCIICRK